MHTLPVYLQPHRLALFLGLAMAVLVGGMIPALGGVKLQTQGIMVAGLLGITGLALIPQRRIALVCVWTLIQPLSLEKVFPLFEPTFRGFMGTMFVLSGADLVMLALSAVLFYEWVTKGRPMWTWTPVALPYLLLVGWVVVIFFTAIPSATGVIQVMHWAKMLMILLTISSSIRTRDELLTVLVFMALAVLVQSVILGTAYGLKRKIGFSDKVTSESMMVFSGGGGESITRSTGTVGHVNQQAMFHVFFTVPVVALIMVRNWLWRCAAALVVFCSCTALLLTFSRASWIASTLAATVIIGLAWRYGRISRMGWLAIGGGVLAAGLVVGAMSGKILSRLSAKGDDGASSSRVRMAMLALDHATTHPIRGVGPGNFVNAKVYDNPVQWGRNVWLPRGKDYAPRYLSGLEMYEVELKGRFYYMPGVVHNKVLLIAAELGLVGLGLFIWFHVRLGLEAVSALRARDPQLWWLAVCLVAFFCTLVTEYQFELFYDDKTVATPIFVCALIIALARLVRQEKPRELTA